TVAFLCFTLRPSPLSTLCPYTTLFRSLISLIYFNYVVLNVSPWFEPRYIIPIAGMMIGNAMTGVTLGVQSLLDNMIDNRETIEGSLMLGATPNNAVKPYVDRAFDSAVL